MVPQETLVGATPLTAGTLAAFKMISYECSNTLEFRPYWKLFTWLLEGETLKTSRQTFHFFRGAGCVCRGCCRPQSCLSSFGGSCCLRLFCSGADLHSGLQFYDILWAYRVSAPHSTAHKLLFMVLSVCVAFVSLFSWLYLFRDPFTALCVRLYQSVLTVIHI